MKYIRILAVLSIGLFTAGFAHAQRFSVGVGVGGPVYAAPVYGPPVCTYGYYGYYPYACAPYGYYGPEWFSSGIFIGAGPWFRGGFYGGRGFHGSADSRTLMITGIGSTVAETFVAAATSVADAVASFTAAMAATSTVAETSTAGTRSAAVAASTAEEISWWTRWRRIAWWRPWRWTQVIPRQQHTPRRPAARSAGRFLFGLDPAREAC